MKKHAIVYWLIPAEPARELFREIIRILAKEFDAPRFEPHLTVAAMPEGRQPNVLQQLKVKPVRLRVRGISFSSNFTKTVFVRFNSSKSLEALVTDLNRAAKAPFKLPHDPHLSLIYKKLPSSVKRELAATIKLPFREVIFDSVKAARCVSPTRNRAEVESWRVVATKKLMN